MTVTPVIIRFYKRCRIQKRLNAHMGMGMHTRLANNEQSLKKIIFFECWPYGQPLHDLVGHLNKLGGLAIMNFFMSVTIKCYDQVAELMK